MMYLACFALFLLFYALEFYLVTKENENFDSIKGVYIIFTPFFPAAIWSSLMWVRSGRSLYDEPGSAKEKSE